MIVSAVSSPRKFSTRPTNYHRSSRLSNIDSFEAHGLEPPQPNLRLVQTGSIRNSQEEDKGPRASSTLRNVQQASHPFKGRTRADKPTSDSSLTQGLRTQYQNGKLVIASHTPTPYATFKSAISRNQLPQSRESEYASAASTLRHFRQAFNTSSNTSSRSHIMSSQPLLQTAPGKLPLPIPRLSAISNQSS